MGKLYVGAVTVLILTFCVSCKKDQPAPSYIYIPSISVDSQYGVSGSSSSKVTNVKVFNNTTLIGVYELPIQVPILSEGPTTIRCIAGIQNYGITSNIADYVFYEPSEDPITLERNSTDTIRPVVRYNPSSTADYWWEDFDGAGHAFAEGDTSNASLVITNTSSEVFEGNGSGKFDLDAEDAYSKFFSEEEFVYNPSQAAYVEMDYRNNQNFFFALILRSNAGLVQKLPIFQFSPTDIIDGEPQWNKIYIEIGSFLNQTNGLASYDICFDVPRDVSVTNPIVMLDNVKVIQRK